jgi:hypothetical protein
VKSPRKSGQAQSGGRHSGNGEASLGWACGTHRLIHFELSVGLGAEKFLRARGNSKLLGHVGEKQEVIEKEPM